MKRLKAIWYDFCVIYNRSLTTKPYIPVSRSWGWCVKKKKYIMAGSNPCSGAKYSSTEPLHYLAMFGHPSGLTIWAGFCSDNPSGMLWIFDQKCSDYIRQKAKNFSKSVWTIIWVRHLYSGVLVKPCHSLEFRYYNMYIIPWFMLTSIFSYEHFYDLWSSLQLVYLCLLCSRFISYLKLSPQLSGDEHPSSIYAYSTISSSSSNLPIELT